MSIKRPQLANVAGGVTAPKGFRAAGLHCGIKINGKPDLSLIVSDAPASAAGVFTTNLAKAAPIYLCQDHLAASHGHARAIITNSGKNSKRRMVRVYRSPELRTSNLEHRTEPEHELRRENLEA